MDRRTFLATTCLSATAGIASPLLASCQSESGTLSKLAKDSYETQLLIIGGGPAGVCAAIAAARQGIRTLLVESGSCLGGMATRGLVSPFMTCFDTTGEVQIIRGLFEEIVQKMVSLGGAIHPREVRATSPYSAWITAGHDHCTPFDAETLKFVLDDMCAQAGVKVLFHTRFVAPLMHGKAIQGAILLTRSGLEKATAQITIDATGDGDVCARAGVPFSFGNVDTKRVQPATLFFHINNVDSARLEADVQAHLHEFRKVDGVSYRALHWHVARAEAAGEWDIARKSVNIYKGVHNDEWAVNCTRIAQVDATSSESLSQGETEGRRQVQQLLHFFHKYVPGCEQATIKSSASTLGIRESRHIQGQTILQADDLLQGKVPDDSILVASNSVDVHGRNSNMGTEYRTVEKGRWYGVPYRCLLPLGAETLLVAGRPLSATSDAAGAVRVMPPVMAMGQAAGLAATLAIKGNTSPSRIDAADLRRQLLESGAFLG